ncbi:MAG TPA: hypothetical protein VKZ43_09645 [Trueperaceae bacterium]|nr:hypothetical protein [Trueperaceae bacterium]
MGEPDPAINPLAAAALPVLTRLVGSQPDRLAPAYSSGAVVFRPVDATLGHEGLPQSATGQTTILTGLNGADIMNGHYGPWPGPTLTRSLQQGTLFHDAEARHGAALANTFPPRYFATQDRRRRHRPNAPVVAARAAGVRLRGVDDYQAGTAIAPDLVGAGLARLAEPALAGTVPAGVTGTAATLTRLAAEYSFTFVDVWVTDGFGHDRDMRRAVGFLETLDALLALLVDDPLGPVAAGATLLITSDHGNLEDLSVKGHTRNHVPLLAAGPGASEFAGATSLLDVAPGVRRVIAQQS